MYDNVISFNKAKVAKEDRLGLNDYNWADSPMNDFTLQSGEFKPKVELSLGMALNDLNKVIEMLKEISNANFCSDCDIATNILVVAKGRLEERLKVIYSIQS